MVTTLKLDNKKKHLLIFLSLFIWSLPAFSQNLRQITTINGLSCSVVTCINQSDDGLIWAGSLDGINLYFGGKAIRPTLIQAFEGEIIEHIVETASHDMWIYTTHGLQKINRVSNEMFTFPQFTGQYICRAVSHDRVAVAEDNSRLHLYSPAKQCFEELIYPLSEGEPIIEMGGTEDFLWIASNMGVYRCNWSHANQDKVELEGIAKVMDGPVKFCSPTDQPEIIYVIDNKNRLYQLNIRQNTHTFILQMGNEADFRGQPSGIVNTNDGYLISFKVNGVLKYSYRASAHRWVHTDLDIRSGVFQMIKDKYQDLTWIATDGQGLFTAWEDSYTLQSYQFSDFNNKLGKPVRSLFVDEKDWLWIGFKGEGLLGIDRSDNQREIRLCTQRYFTSDNSSLKDNSVYALSASRYNGFWVGTETGLNFFRYSDRSLQPVSGGEDIPWIHVIHETDDSRLWIATVGAGVFEARIIRDGSTIRLEKIQHYKIEDGNLSSNYFFAMHHTDNDEWWLGNRGKGLFKIEDAELKAFERPSMHRSNLQNDVFALQKYNDVLWAGTSAGLVGFSTDYQEYVIDTDNGLPNNIIHSMQVDNKGALWVATNNGLARLDSTFTKIESYGRSKGLLVTEFSDGAVYKDEDKVYFGGVNGWVEILANSNYTPQGKFVAPLYISVIGGKSQYNLMGDVTGGTEKPVIKLNPGEKNLSVQFTAMDHVAPNAYHYLYKVDSREEGEWMDNGPLKTVSLSQMRPGDYTLHVKYRNLTTGVYSSPHSIDIIITPHWW